jgi:OOP family OmpA-OmpF porin
MKNLFKKLALLLIIGFSFTQAQTFTNSWALGFGFTYPKLYSANITSLNSNYGAYLSIQRNFSENVGLRAKAGYGNLNGEWTNAAFQPIKASTSLITLDVDFMYYLVPCAPVSPYIFAGGGANYKSISNPQTVYPDDNKFGSQFNIGAGAEFKFSENWSVVTEFGYHVTNNSELEGTIVPIEMNGRDSYISLGLGFNYLFGKGAPSNDCIICNPCEGLSKDMTDYKKIEDMIKQHIPKEVIKETVKETIKEVFVDKYILAVSNDRFVLVGVNFAFDKSDLLPESYPVLDRSVNLLNGRPQIKVEIEGYTDYIGTEEYNQTLSIERAQTVKDYLISKGIAPERLSIIGYGKENPVADNTTDEGRAMNRRIVFRIIK